MTAIPQTVAETVKLLKNRGYLTSDAVATAVFLSLKLKRPLLLEGEAGVGKTEVAKVLASVLQRPLIRLQCYEGLDLASAAYEWDYTRQLLHIRLEEASRKGAPEPALDDGDKPPDWNVKRPLQRSPLENGIYSERFLLKRPLVQALELAADGKAPVLLIDELDRADEPFEAFLLEILADYQITIPELGTIRAAEPPITIITSNRTREVHDAVRRRCFYCWIDYPNAVREREILGLKLPDAPALLTAQIVDFVQSIRRMDLYKNPGISETINWAQALTSLDCVALDLEAVNSTLGTLLKYQDDIAKIHGSEAARLLDQVKSAARQATFQAETKAAS